MILCVHAPFTVTCLCMQEIGLPRYASHVVERALKVRCVIDEGDTHLQLSLITQHFCSLSVYHTHNWQ